MTRDASPNGLQLCGGDFDGDWPGVNDSAMLGAFDGPVTGAVAFDHPRMGAVAAFGEGVSEDLGDGSAGDVTGLVRGESPRGRRLRGGSLAGIA
jgi:hypothetical protein